MFCLNNFLIFCVDVQYLSFERFSMNQNLTITIYRLVILEIQMTALTRRVKIKMYKIIVAICKTSKIGTIIMNLTI